MIEIRNLSKSYSGADGKVEALKNVSLTVRDGEIYGIIGMSGAGKSTLVRCINLLERPTEGRVLIDGNDVGSLSEKELRKLRRKVTMIFQGFNLLMQRTCLQNVCLPLEFSGVRRKEAKKRALELLETVGLPDKANAYPAQLSGGQQQRVAIARALATEPEILLCDEATSALDPKTTRSVLSLLREINKNLGITVVVITHQMSVVEEICDRVAILDGGEVAEEGEVSEIFTRPRSRAAKRLVFPDFGETEELTESAKGEKRIRIIFNGAPATGQPLIAKLAMEKRIAANILSASARTIGGKVYGNLLLGIEEKDGQPQAAIEYFRTVPDVIAEEVEENV